MQFRFSLTIPVLAFIKSESGRERIRAAINRARGNSCKRCCSARDASLFTLKCYPLARLHSRISLLDVTLAATPPLRSKMSCALVLNDTERAGAPGLIHTHTLHTGLFIVEFIITSLSNCIRAYVYVCVSVYRGRRLLDSFIKRVRVCTRDAPWDCQVPRSPRTCHITDNYCYYDYSIGFDVVSFIGSLI